MLNNAMEQEIQSVEPTSTNGDDNRNGTRNSADPKLKGSSSLKIKTGMYILIGLSMVAVTGIGLFGSSELKHQHKVLEIPTQVSAIKTAFSNQIGEWRNILVRGGSRSDFNKYWERFEARESEVRERITALQEHVRETGFSVKEHGTHVEGAGETLNAHFEFLLAQHEMIGETFRKNQEKFSRRSAYRAQAIDSAVQGIDEAFLATLDQVEKEVGAESLRELGNTNSSMIVAIVVIGLILMALGFLLVRHLARSLENLITAARRIGGGDLTVHLEMASDTELGALANTINDMATDLSKIAAKTRSATDSLTSISSEIYQSARSQSAGATEQAAAVSEVTATLEQIQEGARTTLRRATNLSQAAERIRVEGNRGSEAVSKAMASMVEIRERMNTIAETILKLSNQTAQIGEITNSVQALAQQSKMLALNAAIEASKAGEAGKGFGVVAAEVRLLAERSEEATEQVRQILEDIQRATEVAVIATEEGNKEVATGNGLVEMSGKAVNDLSAIILDTSEASQQIVASVEEETTGIEQVSRAMNDISGIINEFANATRQNEQSAGEMTTLAQQIKDAVSVYRI